MSARYFMLLDALEADDACRKIAITLEQPTRLDSAGMNRHGVTNERVVKKGIANHLESESCEGDRKVTLEPLTGAYAGRESSSEIGNSESRRCQPFRKTTRRRTLRQARRRSAESVDPRHA